MTLLITRPQEDAEPLRKTLEAHHIKALIDPMLEIILQPGPPLNLTGIQALLMTSANGVRAFARRNPERAIPLFAVGDATAKEAVEQRFTAVSIADGDVQALATLVKSRLLPADGPLLHVAGTRVAGDLAGDLQAAGFRYQRAVLYEARTTKHLRPETLAALKTNALSGVLLYSPRTAGIFRACIHDAGREQAIARITAFCLSPAVADALGELVWGAIKVARKPTQADLLELVINSV